MTRIVDEVLSTDRVLRSAPRYRWPDVAAALIAMTIGAAMFLTAPKSGEFWWSDAPRHALNGVFVKDLLLALPLTDIRKFATDYYLQYPALTILFYPPLFYFFLAPFYAVFGDHHWTAQLVVTLFHVALIFGAFALARRFLSPVFSIIAAVTFGCLPEIVLWGRQVMLEIPAYAFMVWALVACCRFDENKEPRELAVAAALTLAAIYTKLSAIFLVPVIAGWLLHRHGRGLVGSRSFWLVASLSTIAIAPLAAMTTLFGQGNVQSVTGVEDAVVSRATLAGWTWYLRQLPGQAGGVVVALAALGAASWCVARLRGRAVLDASLLALWFAVGYVFFSLIDLKDARHSVFLLLPVVIAAVASLQLVPIRGLALGSGVVLVGGSFAIAVFAAPVPKVDGYRQAAEQVASLLPQGGVVLFSGNRDGSFIFNVRAIDPWRRISVIRADKLLLRVAIRRELGVEQRDHSAEQIAEMLHEYGVDYAVAQDDFWIDLAVMARLQAVLRSARFQEIAQITTDANVGVEDKSLRIYRSVMPRPAQRRPLSIELPVIDRTIGPGK